MESVLIAGCGRLGLELGLVLAGLGHRVHGIRRRAEMLPRAIDPIRADLTEPGTLENLPRVDSVVFAAAAGGGASEEDYRRIYLDGLKNLTAAVKTVSRATSLFFVSSTAVYDVDDGSWVNEETRCSPRGFRGRTMLEAECVAAGSGLRTRIVRFGGIYGPQPGALVDRARSGRPCRDGHYTNRIHVCDAAGLLAHLLEADTRHHLFLGVDDRPAPDCEVMDWLADSLGVELPPRESGGGPSGKRCDNTRIRQTGYRLRYPDFRAGYEAILSGVNA